MKYTFDFRKIDRVYLQRIGILSQDITEVFEVENARPHSFRAKPRSVEMKEFEYIIGYLPGGKFIHVAYIFPKNDSFDIELLEVGIPDVKDIKTYWCR